MLYLLAACAQIFMKDDEALDVSTLDTGRPENQTDECGEESCTTALVMNPDDASKGVCVEFRQVQDEAALDSTAPHSAVAIVDYDHDGLEDVFVMHYGSANQMFHNLGGLFENVTASVGLNFGGSTWGASFFDYDHDGDLDLAVIGDTGGAIYNNTNGVYSKLSSPDGVIDVGSGRAVVWLDSGVLFATENGTQYHKYLGSDRFTEYTSEAGLDDFGDGSALARDDYDHDGRDDVYLANLTGQNRLFRGLGSGRYESIEDDVGVAESGNQASSDAQWQSFRGEDKPSLYVSDWNGDNQLYSNQQDGTFEEIAEDMSVTDAGDSATVAWGIVNDKIDPAIFVGRFDAVNLMYLPKYNSSGALQYYEDSAPQVGLNFKGFTIDSAWFDYDQDEDLDLLVVMYDGTLILYENNTHEVDLCE